MRCQKAIALLLLVAALNGCSPGSPAARDLPATDPATSRATLAGSASPSASPATAWAATVRAENAQPGAVGWRIPSTRGKAAGLDAYADRVSVRPGEPVGLYVSARGRVAVRALRIGDYAGRGARQVWAGSLNARKQPAATTDEGPLPDAGGISHTHLVVAPWHRTGELDTTGWPEGDYLVRLDAGPASRYVPLTVRSADARGRVLLVAGAMTWEAYNHWGGSSLYDGDDNTFGNRSRAVSFDRPYDDGFGSGRFGMFDQPLVRLAEHDGLPLAWITDYDLANDPALLQGAAAIVIGGHAEYWTAPMRDAVTRAMAAGSNLAVFGANTAYWRVRLAGRSTGLAAQPDRRDGRPRVVVGAKSAALDPLAASDPGGATARFRDSPASRPEEALTGMRYDCFPAETSWTVADPTWWGYADTGVTAGEKLAGVVGPEADRVYPSAAHPRPEQIVAYQPYACGRDRTAHTGVYWVASSGAAVFTAGTMRWVCALEVGCSRVPGTRSAAVLAQVTTNVLTAFSEPRAGVVHPAHDTVGRFRLSGTATTHAT
ncbi:MAG TPA: N,N-dimethylformamidase beta subunit family domain-containing protein [Kineosporiaceae bacterium]|nr:N,N-dimethylformamidase beta subunit family domain-containing protein [Kineosporiaceae bacterium]